MGTKSTLARFARKMGFACKRRGWAKVSSWFFEHEKRLDPVGYQLLNW